MAEDTSNSLTPASTARTSSDVSAFEIIPDPPSAEALEEHKHLIPPSNDQPKKLCGYLRKETTHSLIKTWRQRWVEFDDDQCALFYYNTRNDTIPQGSIDISNATFSYSVENLFKHQFEITTPGYTYNFQANTKDAMFQWINALQMKRRKYLKRKETGVQSLDDVSKNNQGGLMSECDKLETSEENESELNGVIVDSNQPSTIPSNSPLGENQIQKFFKKLPKPPFLPTATATEGNANNDRKSFFYTTVEEEPSTDEQGEEVLNGGGSQHDLTSTASPQSSISTLPHLPPEQGSPQATGQWRPKKPNVKDLLKRVSSVRSSDQSDLYARVQKLEDAIEIVKQELAYKEQEVKDRDEVIDFLRSELKLSRMEEMVRKELVEDSSKTSDSRISVITQRDQIISSLQKTLEQLRYENDSLETELRTKREQLVSLTDEVNLYKETIKAKDHVVVELTNQLFSMEKGGQIPLDPHEAMMPTTTKMMEMEIAKLKETSEAYKKQNAYLTCEMVELNELRTADAQIIKSMKSKLEEKDAEYIRLQSKHVILLKETQTPKPNFDPDLFSQMIEEAIKPNHPTRDRTTSEVLYDSYGFKHDEDSLSIEPEETLDSVVRRLDQQAQQKDENFASHIAKWDSFMIQYGAVKDLIRTDELKIMIRNGIPRKYRGRVWKWCIRDQVKSRYIPGYYQQMLSDNAGKASVALNQIELDLLRTLPSNKYYNSPEAHGIPKLRRVLVAFSWHNKMVGYCQGLNRLAAIALLFLDEEDAFWCLVAVVEHLLPQDYYNKTLLGSQSDQRVLRELITDKMHQLSEHLKSCDIDFSLITFNWFHTIFIDDLPIETMLRIWDTFLFEGSKVLFRYAIAIFKYNEERLLAQENSIMIFNKLRAIAQEATDVNKLTHIAFYDPMLKSFPRRRINQRRAYFRTIIQEELDEVDKAREKVIKSGVVKIPDMMDSDGEEVS